MKPPSGAAAAGPAATASHHEKIAHDHGQRPEGVFEKLPAAVVEVANALAERVGVNYYLICILLLLLSVVKTKKARPSERFRRA